MYRPSRLRVMEVNPYLTCVLCGGYFVDATTIIECLHSFCKTCIVQYLESSKFCPICDVQVHKTRPLLNIRADKTLQDIVYKLVPGLFRNEMKRRRDFYETNPEAAAHVTCQEDRGELTEQRVIYTPDDSISLSLEYGYGINQLPTNGHSAITPESEDDTDAKRRYLQCPAAVTVAHLKKFINMKYGLSQSYVVDIMYYDDSLRDDYKLMDIAYIYTWKRNGPMRLFYRILDKPRKRLKTCHSTSSETPLAISDDITKPVTPGVLNGICCGKETNGVESSSAEEKEDSPMDIQSESERKEVNIESGNNIRKNPNDVSCNEVFTEENVSHQPVISNSISSTSQLQDKQNTQLLNVEEQKKDCKSSSYSVPSILYSKKMRFEQEVSLKYKTATTETFHGLAGPLPKETQHVVEKIKLNPVETSQKSNKQTGLTEAKKLANQMETEKLTDFVETVKALSSIEKEQFTTSMCVKTPDNPVECKKPNSPIRFKELHIPNENKKSAHFINIRKDTTLVDTKKHNNIQAETKELNSSHEIQTFANTAETKKLFSSTENDKLTTSEDILKRFSQTEAKKDISAKEMRKLTSPVDGKKTTNLFESIKLVNKSPTVKTTVNNSHITSTLLTLSSSIVTTSETARSRDSKSEEMLAVSTDHLDRPISTSVQKSPKTIFGEESKFSLYREQNEKKSIKESDKFNRDREKKSGCKESDKFNRDREKKSIKESEEKSRKDSEKKSSKESEKKSSKESDKKYNKESERKSSKESERKSSKESEKKSRKDGELEVSKSPELFVVKPGEVPPLKISRKLSIKIADPDKIEAKEDSEVDSGIGSDISSRPETQLSVEDDLWSPSNSVPETDKLTTPSKPALTPPPTPSPSTSNPCPSPSAGYLSCQTPLHVPSTSPKMCLSPREEPEPQRDDNEALDLTLSHRHQMRHYDRPPQPRPRHVANPPVLDKHRQLVCLTAPTKPPLKPLPPPPPPLSHTHMYSRKADSGRNHRFKGGTLTVINPDPNSYRPKIVIKNLDPRPDHAHHHHNHRM
ncbi:uncharacterized protein DDB_G0284459-like [Limulus polyphemus]|uniref:Uncharacterized protein DDB_G0284459-like n=1 Tax=Limulus polyphemus TaxID=6850 RepID=A0ABM1S9V9_LIMPO|nr:uncharacterized protein DDB_G0284459-like [Limulus polyphemus]XP_022240415.1 uncharacterized protein DDB_G0284459-like [Limulus polyphemus]